MELLVLRMEGDGGAARTSAALPAGSVWAQFGDELVVAGAGAGWKRYADAMTPTALRTARPRGASAERLHVVVQTGRLFQAHHPGVRVLHDRGRFLLVDLDPPLARRLRRRHPTCYGLFPLRAGEVVFSRARPAARAPEAKVKDLVDRVSSQRVSADLARLAGMHTRHSTSADYRRAAADAAAALGDLGYSIRRQRVRVGGSWSSNVVADRKGTGATPRGLVIVTAHLDSVNWQEGSKAAAPGADDNGSGSAGLLEMARVFADAPCREDLRFVLFGGEEQGLFGSRHHVAKMAAGERSRVRAALNMDMIASPNTAKPTVLLEGAPLSRSMLDGLEAAAATYTDLAIERSLHASNSDHVSFLERGMPAVLTIEGADSTNDRVHSARDTLAHVDTALAVGILRMNVAFVAEAVGI